MENKSFLLTFINILLVYLDVFSVKIDLILYG